MTQTPWLSVLIPVYNVLPYLRECFESVREQADAGVEIVLVDDGSTDGSGALMQELVGQDERIRCLTHAC
ncbi:MAG: glycosyltransferase family 2 protein, partial [Burkholderiaceae bacterium]